VARRSALIGPKPELIASFARGIRQRYVVLIREMLRVDLSNFFNMKSFELNALGVPLSVGASPTLWSEP
jgi:hypothetical protein